jgi:adenylate kinase
MRVLITGMSGLNKTAPLDRVAAQLDKEGIDIRVFHVGDMMYEEDPSIGDGRILDLPYGQLRQLRRTVMRDVLRCTKEHIIVNTHATFRWRRGLFAGFDVDQINTFSADYYICLVEDVDQTYLRLKKTLPPDAHDYSMKDLFVWREEELLGTELMANIPQKKGSFLIVPIPDTEGILLKLFLKPQLKRAYISFPITNVLDRPDVMARIDEFKHQMRELFLVFDPFDVKESWMVSELDKIRSGKLERDYLEVEFEGETGRIPVAEVAPCVQDIEGQIVARDLKLIDQSEMVIAFMPDINGQPVNSPGVMREITHGYHATKDIYIIWTSPKDPSPFIKDIVPQQIFTSLDEAVQGLKGVAAEASN